MNYGFDLQCTVCETGYLIKHQIGYRSTEFFFECPTCGIMLSGQVKIENDNIQINSQFHNLEQAKENKEDYFIQLSGEFYDPKLSKADIASRFIPGSFIMESVSLGGDKIQKISKLAHRIIDEIPARYKNCTKVIELIVSPKDNKKYVYAELEKLDSETRSFVKYPSEKEFIEEYKKNKYSTLFLSVCYPFKILLDINTKKFDINTTRQNLEEVFTDNPDQSLELKKEFEPLILELITGVVNRLKSYIIILPKLNPVVTSETFNAHSIEEIKNIRGLNTVDYNDLLSNYADVYEVLGKTLSIYVSINNIKYRKDMNKFGNDEYKSITQFNKQTIGNKLKYMKENISVQLEYNDLSLLNNKIRNAINHYSVSYDSVEQIIQFKDRNGTIELTLIEFANDNYKMLYLLIDALYVLCSLGQKFNSID